MPPDDVPGYQIAMVVGAALIAAGSTSFGAPLLVLGVAVWLVFTSLEVRERL